MCLELQPHDYKGIYANNYNLAQKVCLNIQWMHLIGEHAILVVWISQQQQGTDQFACVAMLSTKKNINCLKMFRNSCYYQS